METNKTTVLSRFYSTRFTSQSFGCCKWRPSYR